MERKGGGKGTAKKGHEQGFQGESRLRGRNVKMKRQREKLRRNGEVERKGRKGLSVRKESNPRPAAESRDRLPRRRLENAETGEERSARGSKGRHNYETSFVAHKARGRKALARTPAAWPNEAAAPRTAAALIRGEETLRGGAPKKGWPGR
ncbi:hypothetical protein KM043_004590 [Ampulex compressa]|nr:hypothetical protein KM043_004590 [Ampulex compressa]